MTLKNNRASLLCHLKLCASFHSHKSIQTGVTVRKLRQIPVKISNFLSRVTLKFDGWPWKTIGPSVNQNCSTVWKRPFPVKLDLEKQLGGHFSYATSSSASFHHHMCIQTAVTVWKWLNGFLTSVTDLDLWPFAWRSLLSMVITPENFMMIPWWEHSEKGVTDGRIEPFIKLLGRS